MGELAWQGACGCGACLVTPGAVASRLSEPLRGRGTNPAAWPASAPRAAGACAPRGSDAGTSEEPRRARRFPAPASRDRPVPALGRTPRLQRRSPATRPRLRALGRAPHGARGVSLRLRRRYPSGAEPGVQRPGVRAPRARWHERRPACPGAYPRSPIRRDGTAPWRVAIVAATRIGPGVDAGRRQPDTRGCRSAADGRGRSADRLQRCTQHSEANRARLRAASRRRHRAAITNRTNTCDMRRPLPRLDMARIGSSMPLLPDAYQRSTKSVSDR